MKAITRESRVILKHRSATWLQPVAAAFTMNGQANKSPFSCDIHLQRPARYSSGLHELAYTFVCYCPPPYMKVRRTGKVTEAFNIYNTRTNTSSAASALGQAGFLYARL